MPLQKVNYYLLRVLAAYILLITFVAFLFGLLVDRLATMMAAFYIVGAIMVVVAYFFTEPLVIKVCQAHPASPKRFPFLFHLIEGLAIMAGIPRPKVYLLDDNAANSLVIGRSTHQSHLLVSTGLLEKLNREELEAVLAYQVAIIKSYLRPLTLTVFLLALPPLLADLLLRAFWWGPKNRDGAGLGAGLGLLFVVGVLLSLFSPLFLNLIKWTLSPTYILHSDSDAVVLTRNKTGLTSGLKKIAAEKKPLSVANKALAHLFIVPPKQKTVTGKVKELPSVYPLRKRLKAVKEIKLPGVEKAA